MESFLPARPPGGGAVDRPWKRQFLGYSVLAKKAAPLVVSRDREKRMKSKLKPILRMGRGSSITETTKRIAPKIRGWAAYYHLCEAKAAFERFDEWLRRRLRCLYWRQWKRNWTRFKELRKRGLERHQAWISATNGRGPWWNGGATHMHMAIPTRHLRTIGYVSLLEEYQRLKRSAE